MFQGYVGTPLHQRSSECVPLEVFSVQSSKKRKRRDGQVDREVSLHLADVNQKNDERQRRNFDILDPEAPEIRDNWYATQVSIHEQLFPVSDNLTTLMFIVASDLSEAQRERLTSSLSLWGTNVPADAFESVRTVLLELFCTPKRSMENHSIPVSGHSGSTSRTFIKGKGIDRGRSKRTRKVFFGEEQAQDSELWSEEDFTWWSEGRKA